jgi:hypothetical protein
MLEPVQKIESLYYAAVCQTDMPHPTERTGMRRNTARILRMIVDYDGRIVVQASPGPGERIVVGPINLGALRIERKNRRAHQMLAHLRTSCYPVCQKEYYPGETFAQMKNITVQDQEERIETAKKKAGILSENEESGSPSISQILAKTKFKF